jgi:hypothetical protein
MKQWSFRLFLACLLLCAQGFGPPPASAADAPVPLLDKNTPADWWFVYKFNAQTYTTCDRDDDADRECPFGGTPAPYRNSQQFVFASSAASSFAMGSGCAGTTDPVGTTFDEIYSGKFKYLVWNDQFYKEPGIRACSSNSCGGPWGHSKGVLAWNEEGEGMVIQVTTPSWPGVATRKFDRKAGNTLGCIKKPNNIQNAQHFFALKLSRQDLLHVLEALDNSSVVTDVQKLELANIGGSPQDIKDAVMRLGQKSDSTEVKRFELSSRVTLISKPSALHVPPWQMLSSVLETVDLKAATWWSSPQIPTTNGTQPIGCWDDSLKNSAGAVEIAVTGQWEGNEIGLIGGQNHAKIGVSTSGKQHLSIFADLNQQGALSGTCASSQNGRGGMFYVLDDQKLFDDMTKLLDGKVAPTVLKKKVNVKDE